VRVRLASFLPHNRGRVAPPPWLGPAFSKPRDYNEVKLDSQRKDVS
jgi:hypothetical protein